MYIFFICWLAKKIIFAGKIMTLLESGGGECSPPVPLACTSVVVNCVCNLSTTLHQLL